MSLRLITRIQFIRTPACFEYALINAIYLPESRGSDRDRLTARQREAQRVKVIPAKGASSNYDLIPSSVHRGVGGGDSFVSSATNVKKGNFIYRFRRGQTLHFEQTLLLIRMLINKSGLLLADLSADETFVFFLPVTRFIKLFRKNRFRKSNRNFRLDYSYSNSSVSFSNLSLTI